MVIENMMDMNSCLLWFSNSSSSNIIKRNIIWLLNVSWYNQDYVIIYLGLLYK